MTTRVTVLDDTAAGSAALSSSGFAAIGSAARQGYGFTTATGSYWAVTGVRLALAATTSGNYTISFGVYALSAGVPSGSALASGSKTVSLGTSQGYQYFNASALGAVATYAMAPGAGYALVVWASAASGVKWGATTVGAAPTAAGGFSYGGSFASANSGTSWATAATTPAFQMEVQAATCFLRGTLILTRRGEVPVEALQEGDLVATKFGGLRPIRWIGMQRFEGRLAGPRHQPIRLARGSLGAGLPSCDLWVSPGHAVLVGEVLAHAGALVNGTTIAQQRMRGVIEYFHLDLGPHDCVLANGAWAESYFEDRNRDSFHNAADFHARFPGHVAERQATCLPIVTAGHPGIAVLRARLAPREARAAA